MTATAATSIPAAVSSIIAAFVSVRDALIRSTRPTPNKGERGAKKKKKTDSKTDPKSSKTPRLSVGAGRLDKTLGEAPHAIQAEYARGLVSHGQLFEVGDVEAQASLTTVLVKLNSGLVEVIAHLLRHPTDVGRVSPGLDFQQVTLLCDASRLEACQSLANLRRRLSLARSPTPRSLPSPAPRSNKAASTEQAAPMHGTRSAGSKSPKTKSSNQVQFAFVRTRPRPGRKSSSTSSTGSSTLVGSPSPPLSSSTLSTASRSPKMMSSSDGRRSKNTASPIADDKPKPKSSRKAAGLAISHDKPFRTSLQQGMETAGTLDAHQRLRGQNVASSSPSPSPPQLQQQQNLGVARAQTVKSFASGSTRLGEIPMHKWPVEYDWDQMSMLNAQAAAVVDPVATVDSKARRGLFAKIFRKTAVAHV